MVYIDWKRIEELNSENFTDDDKDDLLQTVSWYVPTPDVSNDRLNSLIRVMQEILKYKTEQVESLLNGIEQLAAKQGEDLALDRQEMMEEMEQLRAEMESLSRLEGSDSNFKAELLRLKDSNEKLVVQLHDKDKEISKYKSEAEHLTHKVDRLQQEKSELNRELAILQEQEGDRQDSNVERNEQLTITIRQKNKHILQLLEDVEVLQHSAESANSKFLQAKKDLQEVENLCSNLREEIVALNVSLGDCKSKCVALEAANNALKSQVKELTDTKTRNENQLDDFAIQLCERVDEWKRVLDSKQLQISHLEKELERVAIRNDESILSKNNDFNCNHDLQINKLQDEIRKKMEENMLLSKVIDEMKDTRVNEDILQYRKKIHGLEEEIVELKNKLKIAEEEAIAKGYEVCDLVNKFKNYETGIFGLPEATEKIAKLEDMIQDKNHKIEELVIICNKLQMAKDGIVSGIDQDDTPKSKELSLAEKNELLISQVSELKFENRELQKEISKIGKPLQEESQETISLVKDLQIAEENDALRKCLHEILNELQNTKIESFRLGSIEQLLQALDSRHIAGWYHPAMRLQALLHTNSAERKALKIRNKKLEKSLVKRDEIKKEVNSVGVGTDEALMEQTGVNSKEECLSLEIQINEERSKFLKLQAEWAAEKFLLISEKDHLTAQLVTCQPNADFKNIIEYFNKRETDLEERLLLLSETLVKKEEESINTIIELQKEKGALSAKLNYYKLYQPESKVTLLENELHRLKLNLNSYVSSKVFDHLQLEGVDTEELKDQLKNMTEMCDKLQKTLIWTGKNMVSSYILADQSSKMLEMETNYENLLLEKTKVDDMLEISRRQLKYMTTVNEGRRVFKASIVQSLKYLEANSTPETILKLSQELALERARNLDIKAKLELVQSELLKKTSETLNQDSKISSLTAIIEKMKADHLKQLRVCYELLHWHHDITVHAIGFPNIKKAEKIIAIMIRNQKELEDKLQRAHILEASLESKIKEVEIRIDSQNGLANAKVVEIHNVIREMQLNEARYKSQINLLSEEMHRLQELLEIYKKEATASEDRDVQKQLEWEQRIKNWVESQLYLCQIAEGGVSTNQNTQLSLQSTTNEYANQMDFLKRQNSILLKIIEKQKQTSTFTVNEKPDVSLSQPEKRALENAVVSLQNLVNQKEKTINRYCQILKSCKQGQKGIVQRLRLDLANLFETLAQQSCQK